MSHATGHRIDALEGRSASEVAKLLESAHRAIFRALHLNELDRYQIHTAHPKAHFRMLDVALGFKRTDRALIFTIFSKQRPEISKKKLYEELTQELHESVSVEPSDVLLCIVENGAADGVSAMARPSS